MYLWYRLSTVTQTLSLMLVSVGCVWLTEVMKKRETHKRRRLTTVEVRELWFLFGAASFFASACIVLILTIVVLLKG